MRSKRTGLCSIVEYKQFKERIFDAVEEWTDFCDSNCSQGVSIDRRSLEVEVCTEKDARSREWFPMETLAPDGAADADAILDLVDRFCFVR